MKKNIFNNINNEKKLNKKKIAILIVYALLTLLVVISIVLYNKNENYREFLDKYLFRKETYENNLPFIEIDSNKAVHMYAYGKYISILEDNKLDLYNEFGRSEGSLELEIGSPIFESNENYLVAAEKNGQKIYLINGKNIVWQKEIEGRIDSVNVNKNGYVAITILGTSYKTVIKTFDKEGNELFTTYLANANVIATDISNDNKYLAIAEANFSGIVVQSTIKVISIEDAKNKTGESIKYTHVANSGDLIVNIKYQNRNRLICMYDEHIDLLEEEQNTQIASLKNEETLFADINLSSKVVKVVKNTSGIFKSEIELQIIDINSKNTTTYAIESTPKSIVVKDNTIMVNLGTKALFIKDTGWLQKKYESSHEIQNTLLCNNISGIISKNKIEIISL